MDKPFDYPVHPLAMLFPMMADDELAELATDIKANGLIHPIILDNAGKTLIDGRNRLKACELAGVEPLFERLNGQDPRSFIVSVNLARRNLTKGQHAMALAFIYPEPETTAPGRKAKVTTLLETKSVSAARLSQARSILRHSRELALNVLAGGPGAPSLDRALHDVDIAQGKDKNERARVARLRSERPDLADAIDDEALTLEEAEAQAKADADARKQRRWAITVNLVDAVDLLDPQPADAITVTLENFDIGIAEQKSSRLITTSRLRNAAQFLYELAEVWEDRQ